MLPRKAIVVAKARRLHGIQAGVPATIDTAAALPILGNNLVNSPPRDNPSAFSPREGRQ